MPKKAVRTSVGRTKKVTHEPVSLKVVQPNQFKSSKIEFEPKTLNQAKLLKTLEANDINFVVGPNGVGKSFISVAYALTKLMSNQISKIIITRPYVTCGEDYGALPGDLVGDKMGPLLRPILSIVEDFLGKTLTEYFIGINKIEIVPIGFARGSTFSDSVVIVTESQNLSRSQMSMLLSRIGEGCKIICEGDHRQLDINPRQSGLLEVLKRIEGEPDFGFVEFNSEDCVRSYMAKRVIQIYEKKGDF